MSIYIIDDAIIDASWSLSLPSELSHVNFALLENATLEVSRYAKRTIILFSMLLHHTKVPKARRPDSIRLSARVLASSGNVQALGERN